MKKYYIYKILRPTETNDPRHYIGITSCSAEKRFKEHKNCKSAIGNFIKKYNDCYVMILYENLSKKDAIILEEKLVPKTSKDRKKINLINETGGGGYPPNFMELSIEKQKNLRKKRSETQKHKFSNKEYKLQISEKNKIEFNFKSPNGKIYKGKGIRDFCKIMQLDYTCMGRVNSGERKHHKGWTKT